MPSFVPERHQFSRRRLAVCLHNQAAALRSAAPTLAARVPTDAEAAEIVATLLDVESRRFGWERSGGDTKAAARLPLRLLLREEKRLTKPDASDAPLDAESLNAFGGAALRTLRWAAQRFADAPETVRLRYKDLRAAGLTRGDADALVAAVTDYLHELRGPQAKVFASGVAAAGFADQVGFLGGVVVSSEEAADVVVRLEEAGSPETTKSRMIQQGYARVTAIKWKTRRCGSRDRSPSPALTSGGSEWGSEFGGDAAATAQVVCRVLCEFWFYPEVCAQWLSPDQLDLAGAGFASVDELSQAISSAPRRPAPLAVTADYLDNSYLAMEFLNPRDYAADVSFVSTAHGFALAGRVQGRCTDLIRVRGTAVAAATTRAASRARSLSKAVSAVSSSVRRACSWSSSSVMSSVAPLPEYQATNELLATSFRRSKSRANQSYMPFVPPPPPPPPPPPSAATPTSVSVQDRKRAADDSGGHAAKRPRVSSEPASRDEPEEELPAVREGDSGGSGAPAWFHPRFISHVEAGRFAMLTDDTYIRIRNTIMELAKGVNERGSGGSEDIVIEKERNGGVPHPAEGQLAPEGRNPKYYSVYSAITSINHDAITVMHVHAFLEQHGLINQGISPRFAVYLRSDAAVACAPPALAYVDTPSGLVPSTLSQPFTPKEHHMLVDALVDGARHLRVGADAFDAKRDTERLSVNWEVIAAQVGRSPEDCHLAFLEVKQPEEQSSAVLFREACNPAAAALSPFADQRYGGTLSTLAFLAAVAEPALTAAAAEAATAALAAECAAATPSGVARGDCDGDSEEAAAGAAARRAFRRHAEAEASGATTQVAAAANQVARSLLTQVQGHLRSLDSIASDVEERHWQLQENQSKFDQQAASTRAEMLSQMNEPATQMNSSRDFTT